MYRTKIGHVLLNVYDLDRAIDFYTRFLNFRLVERVADYRAFLSGGNAHHEIAFEKVQAGVPHSPPDHAGLNHIAFEVPDKKSFGRAFQSLTRAGLHLTTSDNLISWSIYLNDPDDNLIEIYCDTRHEVDGQPLWRGVRKPLEPERIAAALEDGA